MIQGIRVWKKKHPDLYEFILFNVMSNVATITNFVVLTFSTSFLFQSFDKRAFQWFIFNYSVQDGGLCGFLGFLTAYVCAQMINFIIQRKVVFGANCNIAKVLPWYILTVALAGILSVWLPPHVIRLLSPYVRGTAAAYAANLVNIVIQVLIHYPMMKFVIMKKK